MFPGRWYDEVTVGERFGTSVTVTEAQILSTVGSLAREFRIVAEPSGAVAPAAWLHHSAALRDRFGISEGPVVAVVSGGNLDPAVLAAAVTA